MSSTTSAEMPSTSPVSQPGGADKDVSRLFRGMLPEWINPVLVKEVRQAQRGRLFSVSLIVTLTLAMFAVSGMSLMVLRSDVSQPGPVFFTSVYVFLAAAVLVIVPFQAFVSMGAEWDDNTFEMLVLSNLKPRQIVFGKVFAAVLQGGMYALAFLPFIVAAVLLRGVDVGTLGLIFALTGLSCFCLSVFTVMVSTIVRRRFLRVVTMVALAGCLIGLVPASTNMARIWLTQPELFSEPAFWVGLAEFLIGALGTTALFACIACNMLSHEEENRSTNVRVVLTLAMLAAIASIAFNALSPTLGTWFNRTAVFIAATFSVFVLAFFCSFFVLEPRRLGRRVEPTVPRSRMVALAVSPWLPGSGRGVLYMLTHLAVLLLATFAIASSAAPARHWSGTIVTGGIVKPALIDVMHPMLPGGFGLLAAAMYALGYVLLPAVLFGRLKMDGPRRNAMRVAALLLPLALLFLPGMLGIFMDDHGLQNLRHVGNPERLIEGSWDSAGFHPVGYALVVGFTVCLLMVLLSARILSSLREVTAVSRKNASARAVDSGGLTPTPGPETGSGTGA